MAAFTIYGHIYEHLESATPMLNGTVYMVRTEEGYYIRKPFFEELEYKTVTTIYPNDNPEDIEIVAFEDLPEGYVINGDVNEPDHEIM